MPFFEPKAFKKVSPSVSATSSMVWCSSISKSPFTVIFRSIFPCLAICSNMWSKNPNPVEMLFFPEPSKFISIAISVSLVFLVTVTFRGFDLR